MRCNMPGYAMRLLVIVLLLNDVLAEDYYGVTYIGAAAHYKAMTDPPTKIPLSYQSAEDFDFVLSAKAAVKAAPIWNNSKERRDLKQALFVAQESLLPSWAKWKPFRPSLSDSGDDGSFIDWKTSSENDSADSLTWLNEFFHPMAFVRRWARASPDDRPRSYNGMRNKTVYYQDYDTKTGTPYNESSRKSIETFENFKRKHGQNVVLRPNSELDMRPERVYFRRLAGPCLYSVPFFMEPMIAQEEGVHFFVSANGNLLTTTAPPCPNFCKEYSEEAERCWPGIYLVSEDLDPSKADRSIPPLNNGAMMSTLLDGEEARRRRGFSGVWIDRYVYPDARNSVGVATHGASANAASEDRYSPDRQVSVVLTYENIPAHGVVSKSNFTGQVELFTNGTIIVRYRSVCPIANKTGRFHKFLTALIDPFISLSGDFNHFSGIDDQRSTYFDEYNNTNLTSLPVVALRFDLRSLTGPRSEKSIRDIGRCPDTPQYDADALIIPHGHRSEPSPSYPHCGSKYNCGDCLSEGSSICVWCAGVQHLRDLAKSGNGVCMSSKSASVYCSPPAWFQTSCDVPLSTYLSVGDPWDYYNVTITSASCGDSDQSFLHTLLRKRPRGETVHDLYVAAVMTSHARLSYTWRKEFVTKDIKKPPIRGVPAPNDFNLEVYLDQFLRKQTSAEVAKTLNMAAQKTPFEEPTLADYEVDCITSYNITAPPLFTGTAPMRRSFPSFKADPSYPQTYSDVSKVSLTGASQLATAVYGRQLTDPEVNFRAEIIHPRFIRLGQAQVCAMEHQYLNRNFLTVLERNLEISATHSYAEGQYDILFHMSSNGVVTIACLASSPLTGPTELTSLRMYSGEDPFNVWYLQEAVPPSSTFIRDPSVSEIAGIGSDIENKFIYVKSPFVLRPGRMVSFTPLATCPRCVKGTCDKMTATCVCETGFKGRVCSECSAADYFYDHSMGHCRPCVGGAQGPECGTSSSSSEQSIEWTATIFAITLGATFAMGLLGILIGVLFCGLCRSGAVTNTRDRIKNNCMVQAVIKLMSKPNKGCPSATNREFRMPISPPLSSAPREMWRSLRGEVPLSAMREEHSAVLLNDESRSGTQTIVDEGSVDYF